MPVFFIRSIPQAKTVPLADFTVPTVKVKMARVSLRGALVKEQVPEEGKARKKAPFCGQLFPELELALGLEGTCFY